MNASRFKTGLILVCVLGLGAGWFFEHRARLALAAEILALQSRTQPSEALPEAARPAAGSDYLELMRLRGEVGALRKLAAERPDKQGRASHAPPTAAAADPAPMNRVIPVGEARFAGYATPEDALQSLVFAMTSGDTNLFLASLSPEIVAGIFDLWDGKSTTDIAEQMKKDSLELDALDLGKKTVSQDGVVSFVVATKESVSGETKTKDETVIHFTKVDGEWKFSEP